MPPPLPAELELTLLGSRFHAGPEQSARMAALLAGSIDWQRVSLFARRQGVIPFLLRCLEVVAPALVPAGVLADLRSLARVFTWRGLFLTRELLRILKAFESVGVRAIPYKGPALAAYLFGDPTLRQATDLDFLVPIGEARQAKRALERLGLVLLRRVPTAVEPVYVAFHKEFVFTGHQGSLVVEVQWRIAPWYLRMPEIPAGAWERAESVDVGGSSTRMFAPEDLLLVLCLHGNKHAWERLKWIVDVAELLRTRPGLDVEGALAVARRIGAGRMLSLGLFLAVDLLEAPLPEPILVQVRATPGVEEIARQVYLHLFQGDPSPIDAIQSLRFLARVSERWDGRIASSVMPLPYFVRHRLFRPARPTGSARPTDARTSLLAPEPPPTDRHG